MAGLENHAIRGDRELRVMEMFERLDHGGDQIGAASNGFAENDIGAAFGTEFLDRGHQFVEVAAEAGSGDFPDIHSLRSEQIRIDQIGGLVVRDNTDAQPLSGVFVGEASDRRGLARAQKTTDHDITNGLCHDPLSAPRGSILSIEITTHSNYRRNMSIASLAVAGGTPVRPLGPPEWPIADDAVLESARKALASGAWGRYQAGLVAKLNQKLASWLGCEFVRCCASGTAAVELALRGLGVGPGDDVLMAAYDFPANFKDVLAVGARPVLVDVRSDDAQLDVDQLSDAATPATKAVLVSHLHGATVDMRSLRALADEAGWGVLEDACQMPGALVQGRPAGMWGDVGVMSFGGSKLLTAGRGGCWFTNRGDVAQRIRLFVERGNDLSPLSEIQAALLLPQIDLLDHRRQTRMESARWLRAALEKWPGGRLFPITEEEPGATHEPDFYKFAFWYDSAAMAGLSREAFATAVRAEGVSLWPAFTALHRLHAARRYQAGGNLEIADRAGRDLLVLHHPVLLAGQETLREVVEAIEKVTKVAAELRDLPLPLSSE